MLTDLFTPRRERRAKLRHIPFSASASPLGVELSRKYRKRYKKKFGVDPDELRNVPDMGLGELASAPCGWCGHLMGDERRHPAPGYVCTDRPPFWMNREFAARQVFDRERSV